MSNKTKEKTFEEKVMERIVTRYTKNNTDYGFDYNNCIYYKDIYGFGYWKEYDENDNLIHYKDSDREEYYYDSNGNEITKKEYNKLYNKGENNMSKTQQQKKDLIFEGLIMKRVIRLDDISNHVYGYDHNGNIIYHEVRDKKLKTWSEYNDDGKLIRHKDSKNNIEVYFDGNGNEISEEEFILLYSR